MDPKIDLFNFPKKNDTNEPFIEFRSDTFSRAPEEMLKCMVEAEIGDDVFEDDPTAIKF